MSFRIGETPDREDLDTFPKVARQHELAARKLRVPPGVVLELSEAQALLRDLGDDPSGSEDPALAWIREQLEAGHSLIARSARCLEDTTTRSGAGLGMSVPGVADLDQLAGALALIEAHSHTLEDDGDQRTLMLIQREVPRASLVVVVRSGEPGSRFYAEVHGAEAGPEPLAEGRSPAWAGALAQWPDPSRDAVEALALEVATSEGGPYGVDIEIVVDPSGTPWLVQSRPLTAPLHPGWPAFVEALEGEGGGRGLHGSLILDGEHNPAPLSPAHTWIMRRLGVLRPEKAGDPVVLAGWLYVRELPRNLARASDEPDTPQPRNWNVKDELRASPMAVHEALEWLRDEGLPRARRQLYEYSQLIAREPAIRTALERAEALFVAMIDDYVDRLVPARAAALARTESLEPPAQTVPLTLSGRREFLDVLPAVWDVASPSLADLLEDEVDEGSEDVAIPEDEAAATHLLGEWDDHLFACGLAPFRRLWLYAGERLGLEGDAVFMLGGDELVTLDEDPDALADNLDQLIAARRDAWDAQHQLEPPSRIVDGQPLPHPVGGRLRGLAIGDSFAGPVAQRRDLRELVSDPPAAAAVLCIPSLTSQAAVVLHRLGIRAVCTEYGGALAHGVLMARELALTALIGCRGCTRIPEGTRVRLDVRARRLIPLG